MDEFRAEKINMNLVIRISVLLAFFIPWASAASQDSLHPFLFPSEYAEAEHQPEQAPVIDTENDLFNYIEEADEKTAGEDIIDAQTKETPGTDADTALVGPPPLEAPGQEPQPGTEKVPTAENTEISLETEPEDIKFPIKRNSRVQHYIRRFSGKGKKDFAKFLHRSEKFLPEIEQTLRAEGVPTDIAYLPLIESGFNPRAVSRKNAVGLWQFIRPTGKRYGLRVNSWVDERMHVEKSTLAAARYLRELYDEFGSWELALAAYNCGENRVSRVIRKTGSKDFWKISRKLPRETRNYVPKFNAALIIAKNPEKYGFRVAGAQKDYEIVSVPPRKSLAEIANLLNMGYKEISRYNPSLIGLSTPPGKNYQLKVPKGYGEKLLSVKSEIETLKNVRTPFRTRTIRYTVRRDDSLWKIARKFGTSVERLKHANRLSGSIIRPGQRLKIPTRTSVVYVKHKIRPGENIYVLAKKYGTSIDAIKRANDLKGSLIIAGETLSIPQKLSYSSAQRHVPRKLHHKIIPGDTLGELALRYRVSVSQIKKWNNMSSTTLIAGRNLVIYK